MKLKQLRLKNFRIHKDTLLNFSSDLNFIVGGNGQGKTSILESIYFLCTTKNFKTSTDFEMVNFGKEDFEISGLFNDLTDDNVRIYFNLSENKRFYIQNNKQISKASNIIGKYPVVLLTPYDHSLTQGYSSDRRKFVDSVICQSSEVYLKTLLDYNKTIKQRASLLNQLKENRRNTLLIELEAWNEKLVKNGIELIKYRKRFIDEFIFYVQQVYKNILEDTETPEIIYKFLNEYNLIDEKLFLKLVEENCEEEIRRGINLIGPHKDEFIFNIKNKPLRIYGSQGQHKTFQIGLRFAQFFYLKDKLRKTPMFLLDDVFGELDKNRAIKISNYLREVGQAFITITDFSNFSFLKKSESDLTCYVENGIVNYA